MRPPGTQAAREPRHPGTYVPWWSMPNLLMSSAQMHEAGFRFNGETEQLTLWIVGRVRGVENECERS